MMFAWTATFAIGVLLLGESLSTATSSFEVSVRIGSINAYTNVESLTCEFLPQKTRAHHKNNTTTSTYMITDEIKLQLCTAVTMDVCLAKQRFPFDNPVQKINGMES